MLGSVYGNPQMTISLTHIPALPLVKNFVLPKKEDYGSELAQLIPDSAALPPHPTYVHKLRRDRARVSNILPVILHMLIKKVRNKFYTCSN